MKEDRDSRRSFLKNILVGSAVAVAATAAGKKVQAKDIPGGRDRDEILYHESNAFKDYYKTLR